MIPQVFMLISVAYSFLEYELRSFEGSLNSADVSFVQRREVGWQGIKNQLSGYVVRLGIGSPPQFIDLLLDTASSASLVMSDDVKIKETNGLSKNRFFKPRDSRTFQKMPRIFSAHHNGDFYVNGTWFEDIIGFDNRPLAKVKLGLISYTNRGLRAQKKILGGLLGLGFPAEDTSSISYNSDFTCTESDSICTNIVRELQITGQILYAAYSVWLNDYSYAVGSLMFGAVDFSLMASDMYRFPLTPFIEPKTSYFAIKMNEIYLVSPENWQQIWARTSISVLFDSTRPITSLPYSLAEPMFDALGGEEINGTWWVKCDTINQGGGIGINFSGVEFVFPFSDIALISPENKEYCIPGIIADDYPILGINFLRSLYVVYDTQQGELGIALANTEKRKFADKSTLSSQLPGTLAPMYSLDQIVEVYTIYDVRPIINRGAKFDENGNIRVGAATKSGVSHYRRA